MLTDRKSVGDVIDLPLFVDGSLLLAVTVAALLHRYPGLAYPVQRLQMRSVICFVLLHIRL